MKILKTVQKVPGGMMVIPLLLGVIINTVAPQVLQAGGYVTAVWSSAGTNTAIGIFLFCVGSQIRLRNGGQVLKRGLVLLIAKFLAGAVLGWVVGAIFGPAGILGLSTLAIISAVTNSNGGLFMSLVGTFGDDTDTASQAILNINDGPFLTLVAVGASGMADIPLQSLACAIAPILLGMILGNLDKDISDFLKPGLNVLIPFFAFCLGTGINLSNLIKGGIPGIILGLITVGWSGFVCILADKFILKRPGYAGAAIATAAGNCVATPAAVALAAPSLAPYAEAATVQCAAAVIVTVILVPLMTSWAAKKWGTSAEWEAKKLGAQTSR
ncbi:MAG TPA: 2-keto-3-deoxygluconate permease [Pseudoflavonifractor sp.]|nr:2-keto-3-deoxygluconate permease [Pseudoflavonifractor sp.]